MLNLPINDPEKRVKFAIALLDTARETLPKANTDDLVTFISYLKSRTRDDRLKVHNVNGRLYLDKGKNYTPLPPKTAQAFIQIARKALGDRLIFDKTLGAVYIEPGMEKITLPRNKDTNVGVTNNTQNNVYSQGSRVSLIDGDDKS